MQTTNRLQTRLDLWLVSRGTGAAKRVLSDVDEAWVNQKELQFLDGGKKFVVSSERDGHTHLYLYSIDGKLLNAVTHGDWSVRGPSGFYGAPLGSAWVDEAGGWIYFTALEKSPVERHLYRIHPDGTGMERLTKEDGQHRITMSPDRRSYADVHSAHDTLPSLSVHDASGARRAVVVSPRADIVAPFQFQPASLFTIPAADGFALPARIVKPRGFDASKKYPAIVYIYGGPGAPTVNDSWDYSFSGNTYFDQVLANRGYVVFSVDPRSATGQSKTLENTIARKMMTDGELNDIVTGVKWLKAQPFVDAARVGVWGWSGGRHRHAPRHDAFAGVQGRHLDRARHRLALLRHQVRRDLHEDARGQSRGLRGLLAHPAREGPPRAADARLRLLRRQRPPAERVELHRRAHQGGQALRHDGLPDAQAHRSKTDPRGSTCSRRCSSSGSCTSETNAGGGKPRPYGTKAPLTPPSPPHGWRGGLDSASLAHPLAA